MPTYRRQRDPDTGRIVYVHRVVAAAAIGRPLTHREVVHHIDGNRDNNSPTNLIVYPSHSAHMRDHHLARKIAAMTPLFPLTEPW